MDIRTWYSLLDKGWSHEVEKAIDNLSGDDQLEAEQHKNLWLGFFHGQFQKAESNIKNVLEHPNLSKQVEIASRLAYADLLTMKGFNEEYGEELAKIQLLFESLTPLEQKKWQYYAVWLLYLKSLFAAFFQNDYSAALQMMAKALDYTKEEGFLPKYYEPWCICLRGTIHTHFGEYQKSIDDLNYSIELYRALDNQLMLIFSMAPLANVYRYLGELDLSLDHSLKAKKIADRINSNYAISYTYPVVGMLYAIKGDFKEAIANYKKALDYTQEKNHEYLKNLRLYIHVLFDMKEYEKAKEHFNDFQRLSEYLEVQWQYDWLKALYLKGTGLNFEEKAKAQNLFRKMLDHPASGIDTNWKLTLMFHLIDLLLEEARIFNNPAKIQEINVFINQAAELAQNTPRALILIYILQAKFLLVEGEVDDSLSLLKQAYTLATSKQLLPLAEQAKLLEEQLQKEYTKWKGIIETDTPLNERISLSEVNSYVTEALKIRDLDSKLSSD